MRKRWKPAFSPIHMFPILLPRRKELNVSVILQAMGQSFSVPKGVPVPPSLKNMYKELDRDPKIPDFKIPDHGCLEKWAEQGVLLFNAILTVG